jgi:Cof subfamily protein (haloacid dehalogenase superfamily)
MKALFLDIDGTLIDGGDGPFPDDIAAIDAARKAGHKVFLATGRSMGSLTPALREAPWVDGVIAGCGTTVTLAGKVLYRNSIPRALLSEICEMYLKSGKWCVFEGEAKVFAIGRCPLFDYGEEPVAIGTKDFFDHNFPDETMTKITMQGFLDARERAVFEKACSIYEFSLYSEAIVTGETKLGGMDKALAALGLSRADAVAVGDSENDLEIVSAAGVGVAMGNAVPALKSAARFITRDVGKGGVAEAVYRFVLCR